MTRRAEAAEHPSAESTASRARAMKSLDWLNVPNQITLARLLIAVLLFVFLSLEIAEWGIATRP